MPLALLAGVFLVISLVAPAALQAQEETAVLRVDENIRFEPQGLIVARLQAGTRVQVEGREGGWSRVTFEGFVWEPSLQRRDGGSFDLILSAEEGENLRLEPGGRILGRLNRGTLLNEVSRSPGWIRVRRTAWIWSASLDGAAPAATPPAPAPVPSAPPAPGTPAPAAAAPGRPAADWVRSGPRGSALLAAPDGDTLATARGGSELQVIGREGNWARVRLEGWVWLPGTGTTSGAGAGEDTDVVLRDVSVAAIAAEPARYRGRLVSLVVQFISLERAEAVRTDFLEGEPFLLARSTDTARSFVYLAVPEESLAEARRLQPLERLEVVGRVRAGAAALTGNPVLDLIEFRRVR